jgi:hypothetical protein
VGGVAYLRLVIPVMLTTSPVGFTKVFNVFVLGFVLVDLAFHDVCRVAVESELVSQVASDRSAEDQDFV